MGGGGRCAVYMKKESCLWDETNFPTSGEIQAQMPTIIDVVELAQRKQLQSCKMQRPQGNRCEGRKEEGFEAGGGG